MIDFITGTASWVWAFATSNPWQVVIAYAIVGILFATFKWLFTVVKLRSYILDNLDSWKLLAKRQHEAEIGGKLRNPESEEKKLENIFNRKLSDFVGRNNLLPKYQPSYPLRINDYYGSLSWTAAFWPWHVLLFIFGDVGKFIWNSFSGIFNKISSSILPEVK